MADFATTSSADTDRPLLAYLASLSDELLQQLYELRPCVVAIFRLLPPFAQQCVLQLMFRKSSDWRSWTRQRFRMSVLNALQMLFRLRILEGDLDDGAFHLNVDFRMNYISSLLSNSQELSELKLHTLDEKSRKAANKDLMGKSVERWESILCYLALPTEGADKSVSETTKSLFQYIGLVRGSAKEPEISSTGFQFLLLGRTEQIWTYLIHYMRFLSSKGENVFPILEFLCKLTLCISPEDASIRPLVLDQHWPELFQSFVVTLRELGLIFIRKRKDGWFLLTPLMAQLVAVSNDVSLDGEENSSSKLGIASIPSKGGGNKSGFLIVETNYRVYAYTNSVLQLAILSTFTALLYRFQDIAIGTITRDSIRRALQTGITARQIVQYLSSNIQQINRNTVQSTEMLVPVTVVEQIYLWEQERKRFSFTDGTLYSNFDSEIDFAAMRDFAGENGLALWHTNVGKSLIVKADGDERVKNWWKEYREDA